MNEPIRVLYVDDEAHSLALRKELLEQQGDFEVLTATNAEDGLDILEEEAIDCLLSDLNMPGTDGIEFLKQVREKAPDIPFIVFSAEDSEDAATEAIEEGATDFLPKSTASISYRLVGHRIRQAIQQAADSESESTDARDGEAAAAIEEAVKSASVDVTEAADETDDQPSELTTDDLTEKDCPVPGCDFTGETFKDVFTHVADACREEGTVGRTHRALHPELSDQLDDLEEGTPGIGDDGAFTIGPGFIGGEPTPEEELEAERASRFDARTRDRATSILQDIDVDELGEFSDRELYTLARQVKLPGRNRMDREELIEALIAISPANQTGRQGRSHSSAAGASSGEIGTDDDRFEHLAKDLLSRIVQEYVVSMGNETLAGGGGGATAAQAGGAQAASSAPSGPLALTISQLELQELADELYERAVADSQPTSRDDTKTTDSSEATDDTTDTAAQSEAVTRSPTRTTTDRRDRTTTTTDTQPEHSSTTSELEEAVEAAESAGFEFQTDVTEDDSAGISIDTTEEPDSTETEDASESIEDDTQAPETDTLEDDELFDAEGSDTDTIEDEPEEDDVDDSEEDDDVEDIEEADDEMETEVDASLISSEEEESIHQAIHDEYELTPGQTVLAEGETHDFSREVMCDALLDDDDLSSTNVLFVRFKQLDEDRLIRIAEEANAVKVIAVGYNQRVPESIQDEVETAKINNASDIARLGILTTGSIEQWNDDDVSIRVCFDSVNMLLRYTNIERLFRFLHLLLGKLEANSCMTHFHLDPEAIDAQDRGVINTLFDKIIAIDDEKEVTVEDV